MASKLDGFSGSPDDSDPPVLNAKKDVPPRYVEWDLKKDGDKFKFAPPPPDRDPWSILLEPLMEKDRAQCDTWKDEVNNVLFFATLFSAVVTAFVVESYKSLTANPQDTMVALLSQIATSLNGTSSGNAVSTSFPPQTASSPGSDSAAVRINSFWFISLVLSLTTVLFGIISLQWIREYQSYSELTPKQAFAVFQMRSEGLEKWYLPKVFTALPVLLQGAVILFLIGMVDFALLLGPGVSIPTLVAIGLTLLFYMVTTVLPTLQGLSLYIPFMHSGRPLSAPPQCPYKSPQSRAFRIVFHFTFGIAQYLYHIFAPIMDIMPRRIRRIPTAPKGDPIIPLLSTTWKIRTWQQFDVAWLSLRDDYALQTFNRQGIVDHLRVQIDKLFPVFDVTLGLRNLFQGTAVRNQEGYLAAIYHCFCDISRAVTDHAVNMRNEAGQIGIENSGLHHKYFHALINDRFQSRPCLPEYLDLHPDRTFDTPNWVDPESMLVHHENIVLFFRNALDAYSDHREFTSFQLHLVELQTRTMKYIYEKRSGVWRSSAMLSEVPICTPTSMAGPASYYTRQDDLIKGQEVWWQYANILRNYFEKVGSICQPKDWTHDLHAGKHIPKFIAQIQIDLDYLRGLPHNPEINAMSDRTLESILTIIQERLDNFMDLPADQAPPNINLLFYTAALFLRRFDFYRTHYPPNYKNLPKDVDEVITTLARYKQTVLDKVGPDEFLEERFAGVEKYDGVTRFCHAWWSFIENKLSSCQADPDDPDNNSSAEKSSLQKAEVKSIKDVKHSKVEMSDIDTDNNLV